MNVVVIGAGIAGLTTAIAFARKGAAVTILEQSPELAATGAGLQLSPNATRILARLDLLPAVERRWHEVDRVALRSGTSLRAVADVPAGEFARRRWHAPYGVVPEERVAERSRRGGDRPARLPPAPRPAHGGRIG